MAIATTPTVTLAEFLKRSDIEESPALEWWDGEVTSKVMPGKQHSLLQLRLAAKICSITPEFLALPELRCTVGGRSLIPDVSVVRVDRLSTNEAGELDSGGIEFAPNWVIEILSPGQGESRVMRKVVHCLRHGSRLGWLVDPGDRVVLGFEPDGLPREWVGQERLPVLSEVNLGLTVDELFGFLRVG